MDYDFEKLAKEIVISQLRDSPNAPQAAAQVAHKIVVTAVLNTRVRQDPHLSVSSVCRGIMGGMLILEKDMPATAVALLNQMATIAQESSLDPSDCMTWAMEGIAIVCKISSSNVSNLVREAIEENFMGAGTVFDELLRTATA